MKLKSQNTNALQGSLSNPYFFSSKQASKPTFFQPKLTVGHAENMHEREADAVADRIIQASEYTELGQNVNVQRKCAECKQNAVKWGSNKNLQQSFFELAISPIHRMIGQKDPIQRSSEEDPVSKLPSILPTFEIKSSKASKNDIKETLRDEGNSFSFGWITDPGVFSWEAEVAIHGGDEVQAGNWVLGMLQQMRNYHLNIWWGDKPSQKKCGDSFPEANVRDVKNSMSGSPWFDDLKNPGPFMQDGETKKTEIVDSPGALNIPYQHPEPDFPANFGNFDFGCSFISYLSVFNYNDPLSPEAWKHLRSVNWKTSLKGSFDARESDGKLKVMGGGTSIEDVSNGYPSGFPPKLVGLAAIDKICPISQCWNPKWKCAKVWVP